MSPPTGIYRLRWLRRDGRNSRKCEFNELLGEYRGWRNCFIRVLLYRRHRKKLPSGSCQTGLRELTSISLPQHFRKEKGILLCIYTLQYLCQSRYYCEVLPIILAAMAQPTEKPYKKEARRALAGRVVGG